MEDTKLKIEYMREIREVLKGSYLSRIGVEVWGDRLDRICDSIEKDFGLSAAGESGDVNEHPLLTIEVTDMNKPPLVKYKGQEIKRKKQVHYKWVTREGAPLSGKHEIEIEHTNPEEMTTEFIGKKRLEIPQP